MNFESTGNSAPVPTQPKSLIADGASLVDRLNEIGHRLSKLGDQLHGSEPREASGLKGGAPEPIPSVRRNLDAMSGAIMGIEKELARVESRV